MMASNSHDANCTQSPTQSSIAPGRTVYTVLNTTRFEVPSYYTNLSPVGYGAYGFVVSALDTRTGRHVAIKKNSRIFRDRMDCKRIVREILVLKHLQHDNIVHIQDLYLPTEDGRNFNDVYMISDLMDTNLFAVIRSPQQAMNEHHFKYFVYQILRGLKFLKSANVIHRDLKPANLLVNVNCDLQICDFGLARQFSEEEAMTDYVVTRYYRPPEILLMCSMYDYVVDTWSVGCITVELMTRHTLFKGADYIQQLDLILNHLRPTAEDLTFLETQQAIEHVLSRVKALEDAWGPTAPPIAPGITDPDTRDFISKMLVFDPRKRASPTELLEHPYLADLHDVDDEPEATTPFFWERESEDLSEEELRDTLRGIATGFDEKREQWLKDFLERIAKEKQEAAEQLAALQAQQQTVAAKTTVATDQ